MTRSFLPPRMWPWVVLSGLLMLAALFAQSQWPGALLAVSIYKAHLLALGGWGGYWLDRALFPYDRPHTHLESEPPDPNPLPGDPFEPGLAYLQVSSQAYPLGMLRRAVIVFGCLVCVGLGA